MFCAIVLVNNSMHNSQLYIYRNHKSGVELCTVLLFLIITVAIAGGVIGIVAIVVTGIVIYF